MIGFVEFPKIPRLSRDIVVTEKIDGTNAAITIVERCADEREAAGEFFEHASCPYVGGLEIRAQSRSRIITPGDDNFGFAAWVYENADELVKLGEGTHFGEWWGSGIQRGYGLEKGEKRFSLFNTHRWRDEAGARPACCGVVPVLYSGAFTTEAVERCVDNLRNFGSVAAPGFSNPEGVIVFHTAGNLYFKKTIYKDQEWKGKEAA